VGIALGIALAGVLAVAAHAASKDKRFGLEGIVTSYDAEKSIFQVRVTATSVTGGFGTGGIAGAPAPEPIKAGETVEFEVVPEGSVLKRTVIKSSKGGGLDNTGTKEGFAKAASVIPKDRAVVISFEESGKDAPAWRVKMVQIRLSREEIEARLREVGIDPNELEADGTASE
jgi:hypothetical protein